MKIIIENTSRIVTLEGAEGERGIPARVWEGETESGIKVQCLITRIAALKTDDLSQFDRELQNVREPSAEVQAFPLRLIL